MNMKRTMISLSVAAMMVGATSALAQEHPLAAQAEFYSPPNEFYLFDSSDSHWLTFSHQRALRICDKTPGSMDVGLKLDYDGKSATVEPGACMELTANRVKITPAAPLPDNMDLTGTIETQMSHKRAG